MTIIEAIAHESKLAEEGDAYHKQLADWLVQLLELEIEGEKLRELVDELYPLASYGAMDGELDRAHDLMRELGVDV